jgi:large-conductance mechanosensitive channel
MVSVTGFAFAEDPPATDPATPPATGTDTDPAAVVPPAVEEPKPVKILQITSAPSELNVGDEGQLQWQIVNGEDGDVVYFESSNQGVALVDGSGKVAAVGPGTVEITAISGDMRNSVLIKVRDIEATSISIEIREITKKKDQSEFEIKVGDVLHLSAVIAPEGSKVGSVTWEISDTEVATLDNSGEFIATKKGTTEVTVTADSLTETITFVIGESGIALATILKWVIGGVVGIAAIIIIIVLAVKNNKMKKAAKKRASDKKKQQERLRREIQAESEKLTPVVGPETKIYGTAVGAGKPENVDGDVEEEPFTLDDLE